MSRLPFRINVIALLIVGFIVSSLAPARQTTNAVGLLSSTSQGVPGRPTLKRRKPVAKSSPKVSGNAQQLKTSELKLDEVVVPPATPWFKFEGLSSLSEEEMLSLLTEKRPDLPKQKFQSVLEISDIVATIKTILAEHGWENALVFLREDQGPNAGVKTFVIFQGERVPIADVRFEGSQAFPSEVLSTHMIKCSQNYRSDLNNRQILDVCLRRTENFMREDGYLQANFGEPRKEILAGATTLLIPVKEGPRYRLGKIEIEGSTLFSPEQILKILDIRPGDIANGEKISQGLFEDLKDLFAEKGYMHYTSEAIPEFHSEGIVDFRIIIEEGPRFKVRSIRFKGHDEVSREFLKFGLSVNEGDYFNHKLFHHGIKELSKFGFEVDPDKDVEFRADEEEAVLDIMILLKRPEGN